MKAILLAAGFGTRLRPITDTIPKCLVPINGRPLLDIWLERLSISGFNNFLVNSHYLSHQVAYYLHNSAYLKQVLLVHEPELLGTAGTLIENLSFYNGEDGLMLHADNYCEADFIEFRQAHNNRPEECVMTMMTFRASNPSSCGVVELDERGVVVGFHEKVEFPPGSMANGAIYLLSNQLLIDLKFKYPGIKDFSTEVLPDFVGRIFTYECGGVLVDIGTPEAYKAVCN